MHVTHHGPYALVLAFLTGALVDKMGIFEGLLIAMAVHSAVHYLVDSQMHKRPTKAILGDYMTSLRNLVVTPDSHCRLAVLISRIQRELDGFRTKPVYCGHTALSLESPLDYRH